MQDFSLGCNGRGIRHCETLPLEEQFKMLRDSQVFDHFDRMPQPGEEREYIRLANKYGMPLRTGLWSYTAGRDEAALEKPARVQGSWRRVSQHHAVHAPCRGPCDER